MKKCTLEGNDHKSDSSSSPPGKGSSVTIKSDESARDSYGIEVISSDLTKIRMQKPTQEESKLTKLTEEAKYANIKTKSKINVKIPFPSFRLSTRTCCTILSLVGLMILITACAGVGVYFITNKTKNSNDKVSPTDSEKTNNVEHKIQLPNILKECISIGNLSESEKRCAFTKINYHKNCDPVKCYQMKYTFVVVQNDSETSLVFESDPKYIATVQTPSFSYCDLSKWCIHHSSSVGNYTECEHNPYDKTTSPAELRPSKWVDSCGVQFECMTVANDILSTSWFEIIRSYMYCNETRRTVECKEGLVEHVPEVYFVSCDHDPNGGDCEGLPIQVRKCLKCNEYEPSKLAQKYCQDNQTIEESLDFFGSLSMRQYCYDNHTVFAVDECKWYVSRDDVVLRKGQSPDGSHCVTNTKHGLCVLGKCFAIGTNEMDKSENGCRTEN